MEPCLHYAMRIIMNYLCREPHNRDLLLNNNTNGRRIGAECNKCLAGLLKLKIILCSILNIFGLKIDIQWVKKKKMFIIYN